MKNILILNGPNLNLLGTREPALYGAKTLKDVEALCTKHAKTLKLSVTCMQSNHEGDIIDAIHAARGKYHGIIINAGAFTHTSVALHDALMAVSLPVIEVHISNIYKREVFRHHSYISPVAVGVICGLGIQGYTLALDAMKTLIS